MFVQSGWTRAAQRWLLGAAVITISYAAHAHGIVGNRVFPGTLAFDDPAVMDEFELPTTTTLKHPDGGADITDNRIGWSFTRLLTPTVSIGVDSGWIQRNWGVASRSGFDTTALTLKDLLYRNEVHEVMISTGVAWGIGHSGGQGVGTNLPDMILPGIFFGKGFGDAPGSMSWLRPFAITGAITLEHPTTGTSINSGINEHTGALGPMLKRNVDALHWGFSLQYSTFYLTSRFTPGKLPHGEPVYQFIPLVEFAFDSPRGEKTASTMNPGLAYVAGGWQVAAEAIVPLNTQGGSRIGARAQLLLFLDDLIPSMFGRPLFGR
jgi:hypothetical protein